MSIEIRPTPEEIPATTRVIDVKGAAAFFIGLVFLVIGLAGGYALRVAAAPASTGSNPASAVDSPEALMEFAVAQVRHFQGDPNAPVTLVEFSDFQ